MNFNNIGFLSVGTITSRPMVAFKHKETTRNAEALEAKQ